ncbi:hypothetical protein Fmac_013177 [Flemingia macrophylla]|uniref:Uncharacterized protein n=1 Tax=Flemingia macrophylla TaxID=520843 RepID=A0ABD1MSV5_9FABA
MNTVFTGRIGNLCHRFREFRKLSQSIFSGFSRKSVRISNMKAAQNPCELIVSCLIL